ncbi:MAG: hypothetical protein F6K24_33290 [Okeania sp. SIO2D1]|nr:hypothetical protein [Okeania sp. SIO2D1]
MLQIARIFLRSQPTPRPSPSQEWKLGENKEEQRGGEGESFFITNYIKSV